MADELIQKIKQLIEDDLQNAPAAAEMLERLFGLDCVGRAIRFNNLAELYLAQKRSDEAETCLIQAITSIEDQLGSDHPNTVTAYRNLENLRSHQNLN